MLFDFPISGCKIRFVPYLVIIVIGWRWSIQWIIGISQWNNHSWSIVSLFSTAIQSGFCCTIRCSCSCQCYWSLSKFQLCINQRFIFSVWYYNRHSSSTWKSESECIQCTLRSIYITIRRCTSSSLNFRRTSTTSRRFVFSSSSTSSDIGHFAWWSYCSCKSANVFYLLIVNKSVDVVHWTEHNSGQSSSASSCTLNTW